MYDICVSRCNSATASRGRGYSEHARKINCGLRSVNAARYNRDYFINKNSSDDKLPDVSFSPEELMEYVNGSHPTMVGNKEEITILLSFNFSAK